MLDYEIIETEDEDWDPFNPVWIAPIGQKFILTNELRLHDRYFRIFDLAFPEYQIYAYETDYHNNIVGYRAFSINKTYMNMYISKKELTLAKPIY